MRKVMPIVLVLLIMLMTGLQTADADRGRHGHGGGGHVGVGIVIGPGWWPYPYYPTYYPYYPYYQVPVVVERPAEIYVQPQPQAEAARYWYYCKDPAGYYPSVKSCPKGWMKVVPPARPPEGEE